MKLLSREAIFASDTHLHILQDSVIRLPALSLESGTSFMYGSSTDWVGKLVEKISGMNLEE